MKKFTFTALAVFLLAFLYSCTTQTEHNSESSPPSNPVPNALQISEPVEGEVLKSESNAAEDLPPTSVEFYKMKHDFGKIKQGEVVQHTFKFKNTGAEPLSILNVKKSCGCTTPEWTNDPIKPGEEGEIRVEFDSKGKRGSQNKSITVEMNTDKKHEVLSLNGEIMLPE